MGFVPSTRGAQRTQQRRPVLTVYFAYAVRHNFDTPLLLQICTRCAISLIFFVDNFTLGRLCKTAHFSRKSGNWYFGFREIEVSRFP